jgi:ATP-dependent 26S proteasome regulatory subunit
MLKLALESRLPLIHVTTDDTVNVREVLSFLVGNEPDGDEEVKVLGVSLPKTITKPSELQIPQADVYFTSDVPQPLSALYRIAVDRGITFVFVNGPRSPLMFDGGVLVPPKDLMVHYLTEMGVGNPDELVPAFGGLTLKDLGEVTKMTMTRDESLTVRGVNTTRRGYTKLQGITQVDTDQKFYVQPGELADWLTFNTQFFHGEHQRLRPRGLLFKGPPGCLSGDTVLLYRRGKRNSGRPITLRKLYMKFNGLKAPGKGTGFRKDAPTYLHSMQEDGSLRYNRIISIIEAGVKSCVRIVTKTGNTLTLTPDHPVCMESGEFRAAGELLPGDKVRVKGSMLPTGTNGKKKRTVHRREICVLHHPVAGTKEVEGYVYKRLHFSRVMVEAHMNKLSLFSYVKRLNEGKLEGLKFLSSDQEVHHIDENVRNDTLSNLVVMNKDEHARHHGKVENFQTEYVADDEVVAVLPVEDQMTYDIQMNMPCHNFVAENFIVHNTGKTEGAKAIASAFGVPLYRLDLGTMMGKFVGDSENNLNAALQQIDEVEPCVVIFDEVEKVFKGASGGGDSGVTARMLSQLLWWLQEHKTKVFTVMTTNDVNAIPQELYRPGRIDRQMHFGGIDNWKEAYIFAKEALMLLLKDLGQSEPNVEVLEELQKRIKSQFNGEAAVPQARLVETVNALAKEVMAGAAVIAKVKKA